MAAGYGEGCVPRGNALGASNASVVLATIQRVGFTSCDLRKSTAVPRGMRPQWGR